MDQDLFFVKQSLLHMKSTFLKQMDMMTFCLKQYITVYKQQMVMFHQECDEQFAKLIKQIHEIEDKTATVYPMEFVQASYGAVEQTEQRQGQLLGALDQNQPQPPPIFVKPSLPMAQEPVVHVFDSDDEPQEAQVASAGRSMEAKQYPETSGSISAGQQEEPSLSADKLMKVEKDQNTDNSTIQAHDILDALGLQRRPSQVAGPLNMVLEPQARCSQDARSAYNSLIPYSRLAVKNTNDGCRLPHRNRKMHKPRKLSAHQMAGCSCLD